MGACVSKDSVVDYNANKDESKAKATPTPEKPPQGKQQWVLKPTPDIRLDYELGKVLGKGQFGTTRLAIHKKESARYAVKSVAKRKLRNHEDVEDIRREVQIMHHLAGHANIVQLKGTYEDKSHVHLVMELCSGGELFDSIVKSGHYSEKQAAAAIRTMVSVVAHCHSMGVIHRDLKPENFLLADGSRGAAIKATDFGLSAWFKEGGLLKDVVGSPFYVAPEVLRKAYSKEADIWSCGVILYILLSGTPPFAGESDQKVFERILKAPLSFSAAPWPNISDAAKDVVRRMLVRDPKKRATAADILQHEWVRADGVASDTALQPEVLKRLRGFAAMNKLKKEALKIIAINLPKDEIEGLKAMFHSIDTDKSGTITVDELRESLKRKGALIPEAELHRIMAMADVNGDGTIDYEEFMAATLYLGKAEREDNMFKAFQYFDKDGSGTITKEELIEALTKVQGSAGDIQQILAEVDKDGNGVIDYEEFCAMMRAGGMDGEEGIPAVYGEGGQQQSGLAAVFG